MDLKKIGKLTKDEKERICKAHGTKRSANGKYCENCPLAIGEFCLKSLLESRIVDLDKYKEEK